MNCRAHNVFTIRDAQEYAGNCQSCMKKTQCPAAALVANQQPDAAFGTVLHRTIQPGKPVVSAGERFDGLYMVRSGFFKSYFIDADGVMQVTGFHFPGEIFGTDGIEGGTYSDTVEALDTGSVCKIPLSLFTDAPGRSGTLSSADLLRPGHQRESRMLPLLTIMSRTLARDRSMIFALGKMCARRRFATFLLDLSARMAQSGYDSNELRLCMSRTDISNYLCLALETVSRLFTQLHTMGIIAVERRNLKILDLAGLQALLHDEPGGKPLLAKAG
jgi:CRP/FNR family transcriptional regulator